MAVFSTTAQRLITILLAKGFLAKEFRRRMTGSPGAKIFVTQQVTNITAQINQELSPSLKGKERFE